MGYKLQILNKFAILHLSWTSQTIVVGLYNPSRRNPLTDARV
jgi:hypothetical protein